MKKRLVSGLLISLTICLSLCAAHAQQTGFTYQGKLTDNGSSTNGNYDLQFALFDSDTGGLQIGQTQAIANVSVRSGVFTVALDFGPSAFSGGPRFLETSTSPSGVGNYTLLTPRQPITSTPYAVRSLSAASADTATDAQRLGGATGDQYVQTTDSRLSDSRAPAAGSTNYIQNTTTPQANSNFSISGNGNILGTLGVGLVVANHYKLGGRSAIRSAVGNSIELGDDGGNVGIGWFIPDYKLEIRTDANKGLRVQTGAGGGAVASFGGFGDFQIDAPGVVGGRFVVKENGDVFVGKGRFSSNANGDIFIGNNGATGITVKANGFVGIGWSDPPSERLDVNGGIRLNLLGAAGSTTLCLNDLNQISFCSSSLRYKTDLHPFTSGLNLINRLQPLTFRWKADRSLDLGLGAEDVAAAEPLLVTRNADGEIEGVKYDRLNVVLINAIKEQQAQIKSQEDQINAQDKALAALRTQLASLEQTMRHPRSQQRKNFRSRS